MDALRRKPISHASRWGQQRERAHRHALPVARPGNGSWPVPPATRSGRLGAQAFDAFGPVGVVAVRQTVAAAVLLPVARPPLRRTTWPQWSRTLLVALVFATMYLTLYTAIDRIGLALAITPEVVGAVDPG